MDDGHKSVQQEKRGRTDLQPATENTLKMLVLVAG